MSTHWNKEELKIYLLIYCAQANFNETPQEIDYIKAKAQHTDFEKIHAEFEKDNDYQSLEKIEAAIEAHGLSSTEIDHLFDDIKTLFLKDGDYDILEQNLYRGLQHLLK
ncbi:MAG: hypothetical protein CL596_08635 [Alteromonas sp.]|nr:hypothetical protein [Alteromonas sp.]MAY23409.1 hypothetical protein [Flavobacteriaceae bacterium]|tara:strand:- start:7740 stop:8066 length:327 start_codon:yes stop_codon:yes gene_type:complete